MLTSAASLLKINTAALIPPSIELRFGIGTQHMAFVRLVYVQGEFSFITTIRRITDITTFKHEASKSEFMSLLINSLSHEFMTPLAEITRVAEVNFSSSTHSQLSLNQATSIQQGKAATPLLQSPVIVPRRLERSSDAFGPDSPVQGAVAFIKKFNQISQVAQRLILFVSSLLTYSQILNQKFEPDESTFSIHNLLVELCSYYEDRCAKKQIALDISCDPSYKITSDKRRLASVLNIFIDNSIKFTSKPGTKITVSVELDEKTQHYVLKVIDNGIGISKKDLDCILKILQRPFTNERTSSSAGLGIGLRIAQAIICELSKFTGTMAISSLIGSGTTITFELPAKQFIAEVPKRSHSEGQGEQFGVLESDIDSDMIEYKQERNIEGSPNTFKVNQLENNTLVLGAMAASIAKHSKFKLNTLRLLQKIRTVAPYEGSQRKKERFFSSQYKRLTTIVIPEEPKRVMIVDDEAFTLEYVREMLDDFKLDVVTANSPERAIEVATLFSQNN
jgi:signal transduction histidine kinase